MLERFCPYCQCFRADAGFRTILHPKTMSKRGMCPYCQEKRKRPHSELVAMAEQDKIERKKK